MGAEPDSASGWSVETLRAHLQRQLDDLRAALDERHQTQTKAVDTAFIAQQTAMQAALQAVEKAITKAEIASDKRFESVNAFRAQLNDQAATFMPRAEHNARKADTEASLSATRERHASDVDRINTRITEIENRVTSRLDLLSGQRQGADDIQARKRAQTAQLVAIVSTVLFAISVATAILLGFN
jgi:hypothetical protein